MSNLIKLLKPILYKVEMVKTVTPGVIYNKNIDHQVIVHPNDSPPLIVNACSKGYTLVKNEDLFLPLAKKLEERHKKVDAIVKFYRNSKFYVDFIIKDFVIKVLEKDYLYPRLRAINSYDGSITYRFDFGFYRLACTNMINANTEILDLEGDEVDEFQNLNIRHTLSAGEAINKTLSGLDAFLEFAPKIKRVYRDLAKKTYTVKKATERLEKIAQDIKYPANSREYALQQLTREIENGFPASDYIIYNCLNYGLYNNPKSQMKDHKRDKIDLRALSYVINH